MFIYELTIWLSQGHIPALVRIISCKHYYFLFTASKQSRKTGAESARTTSATSKPSVPKRPPHQEATVKKPPKIEKENSYDASGSDSDDLNLSGKLSPKDDIGYETGSFDEIDGSNSETTSPAAGEENKTILNQNQKGENTAGYSQNLQTHKDENNSSERLSYVYAGEEFRPLIITESGGIAGPLESKKSLDQSNNSPSVDQRRAPMRYEEVEVLGGKFDRANVNTAHLRPGMPGNNDAAVEDEDDTYETVNHQNISRTQQISNARQKDFTAADGDQDAGDVYAVVQKDKTKKENKINPGVSHKNQESEIPPEIPSRSNITKSDLCESISGELQDMIDSYDDHSTIGEISRSSSKDGYSSSDSGKLPGRPPPLPKPYSGPGIGVAVENNEAASSEEGMFLFNFIGS